MPETEGHNPIPANREPERRDDICITTIEQLSVWIDAQLVLLEDRHQEFATTGSTRHYYQR